MFFVPNIWSFLALLILGQGIVSIFVLLFKKNNKISNRYLAVVTLLLIWLIAEYISITGGNFIPWIRFYGSRFGAWYLFGPLFFLYISSLTIKGFSLKLRHSIHFIPFSILSFGIIPLVVSDVAGNISYGVMTGFMWSSFDIPQIIFNLIFTFQFIHAFLYVLWSWKQINNYTAGIESFMSNIEDVELRWLKKMTLVLFGVLIFSLLFYTVLMVEQQWTLQYDYLYVLPLSILVMVIVIFSMKQGDISDVKQKILLTRKKYEKSALSEEQSQEYMEQLLSYMNTQKAHTDPDLKLYGLAETLDISPNHLSQVINRELEVSFLDFVNGYRIEEAKKMLTDTEYKDSKILGIAFDVGFNNVVTFNKYFKKYTRMTPSQFKESPELEEK